MKQGVNQSLWDAPSILLLQDIEKAISVSSRYPVEVESLVRKERLDCFSSEEGKHRLRLAFHLSRRRIIEYRRSELLPFLKLSALNN